MIGQGRILNWVNSAIDNFPHFVVFVGQKGMGKRTLAKTIAKKLDATYVESGIKVDDVRSVIDLAYNVTDKTMYVFPDCDTMRAEAKNAMLKITEEPPKNAYFIMTVQDDSSLLDTIKSRAYVQKLDKYRKQELVEYSNEKYSNNDSRFVMCDIASTPHQVDMLLEYGQEFVDYVKLVIENIGVVQSANAFKSADKLALKNDEGYDLKLFWGMFLDICLTELNTDPLHYARGIEVTLKYYNKANKLGVNKQQLYDMWVLDIRSVWYDNN